MSNGTVALPLDVDEIAADAPEWPESERPRKCPIRDVSSKPDSSGDSVAVPNTQTPRRTRATNRDDEFLKRHCVTRRGATATHSRTIALELGEAIGIGETTETFVGWNPNLRSFRARSLMTWSFRASPPASPFPGHQMWIQCHGPTPPRVPSDSSKQLNAPPTNPDPRRAGRSMPSSASRRRSRNGK